MEAAGIPFGSIKTGRFKLDSADFKVGDFVEIISMSDDQCYLQYNGQTMHAKPLDAGARHCAEDTEQYPDKVVSWICSVESGGKVTVQSHRFEDVINLHEPLKIGVTDRALSFIRKDHQTDPLAFVNEHFVFGAYSFCSVAGGTDLKNKGGFTILGSGYVLHVEKRYGNIWLVSKMSKLKGHRNNQNATVVVKPRFTFTIESDAASNEAFNMSQLDQIVQQSTGYLSIWEQYNSLEEQNIRNRFQEFGRRRYESSRYIAGTDRGRIIFEVSDDGTDAWYEGELFDVEAIPLLEKLSDDPFAKLEVSPIPIGTVVSVKGRSIEVELEASVDNIPTKGYLQLSISGDRPRIVRRQVAKEMILQKKSEISHLGNILENVHFQVRQVKRVEPLDAHLIATMKPNDGQREALDAALNTPDIAIIQGPPGTGKTRVIKAIVHRLYELNKDNPEFSILISSYQHDAVDNAVKDLVVAGMPAVRYGGRRGAVLDFQDELRSWIAGKVKELGEKAEGYRENQLLSIYRELKRLYTHWRFSPGGLAGTRNFVLEIEKVCTVYLDGDWADKFHELHGKLSEVGLANRGTKVTLTEPESKRLEELLTSQRTTFKAFDDDGAFTASRLLRFISAWEEQLPSDWVDPLRIVSQWDNTPASSNEDAFYAYLGSLVQINKWVRTPTELSNLGQSDVAHPEVDKFCVDLLNDMKLRLSRTTFGISDALDEFIETLRSDPVNTRSMLRKYSVVAAATCQQSAQKEIEKERQTFDVVIIDEAARANPLDLFIPMVKGRKVILVGDQAQLPHILEQDIERELMKSDGVTQDIITKSLFERLFDYLSDMEKTSGIRRTARLDVQYRMHKKIGDFVAEQFYDYKIESEVVEEQKAHGLRLYGGKPMAWIDVPLTLGPESGRQSYYRKEETKVLLDELEQILRMSESSSDGSLFMVGIITFYKNQEKLLFEEIDRRVFPEHWMSRIKVGTVDAFQGREFDAVLLSTVRSNSHVDMRQRVGFLELRNRLNVAFSRAQKLLVVVGDSETVAGNGDQMYIPSLHKFYQLCTREDGFYERRTRL